jgi:large subunit ribosomal protein L19
MQQIIREVEQRYQKPQVVDVRSGDTVRVHQRIQEGGKSRVQVFEGLVIRTDRKNSLSSRITVRRISSGVGVEKSFLLHSPLIEKVEVTKRSKVRRNNLSYMRGRAGKAARMTGLDFDREAVNTIESQQAAEHEPEAEAVTTEGEAAPSNEKPSESPAPTDQKEPANDSKPRKQK